MTYFLRWNLESLWSHIYFLINIHTWDDKEDPRTPSSSCQQSAQPEDDGSLVLLDHLHHEHQGEGERDEDEEQWSNCHDQSTDTRPFLTTCRDRSQLFVLLDIRSSFLSFKLTISLTNKPQEYLLKVSLTAFFFSADIILHCCSTEANLNVIFYKAGPTKGFQMDNNL